MKQNSSILFHDMRKKLINSYLRGWALAFFAAIPVVLTLTARTTSAAQPEYLASFDAAKGFRPAQSDLTEVFLQIAGSLEYYGSPEPYLRHMKAEHARIEAKYRQRFGRASQAYWPQYMTDEYFVQFAANWNVLAPKVGLESIAKNTGNCMRDAINGTRGTGTILVGIFNHHQAQVFDSMAGKRSEAAGFDALKTALISRLYLDQTIIHDEHFSMAERDAEGFTAGIRGPINDLFGRLDATQRSPVATQIKAAITSMFIDTGRMAQAELEAGITETAMDRQSSAKQTAAH